MDIHVVITLYDPCIVPYKTWKLILKIFWKIAIYRQIVEHGMIKLRTWRKNVEKKKIYPIMLVVICTMWHKQWHLLPPTTKLKMMLTLASSCIWSIRTHFKLCDHSRFLSNHVQQIKVELADELLKKNYTNFTITITIHLKYQDIQNQVGLNVF